MSATSATKLSRPQGQTPAAPARAAGTRKVQIVGKDTVFRDRVLRDGEVIEVDPDTAERWTWTGRAVPTPMIQVRLSQAVFLGTGWHEAGEVLDVEEHTAIHLYEYGTGVILEVGKIHGSLPQVKHPVVHTPFDPYAGVRLVKAIVKGSFVWGFRVFSKNDEIELPESKARDALEHKAIELAPGQRLTEPPPDLAVVIPPAA